MAPPPADAAQGAMTNYLFVYGTLLRRSRHPMAKLLADQARHVGEARVRGRLYDLGRYPGVAEVSAGDEWVYGDVYALGEDGSLLTQLDEYEKVESPWPAYFDRQLCTAIMSDGSSTAVWIYWYRGEVLDSQRIHPGRY